MSYFAGILAAFILYVILTGQVKTFLDFAKINGASGINSVTGKSSSASPLSFTGLPQLFNIPKSMTYSQTGLAGGNGG